MKMELRTITVNHPTEGAIKKVIIVYLDYDGNEITRENYTELHPLYGVDPNNLTRMDKLIIKQLIGM